MDYRELERRVTRIKERIHGKDAKDNSAGAGAAYDSARGKQTSPILRRSRLSILFNTKGSEYLK